MSFTFTGTVATALLLGVMAIAHAQPATPAASVPRVVRLDGQFVPANGLPPAAIETVTLAIYASDSDATPLWEETQDVRVDAQGRYAILLGATSAEGVPASVLSGEARWLGMRFARPGEGEQTRVPLTSVPYALRASDADTLGGLPPSAFLRAAGTDGVAGTDGADATHDRATAPRVSTGTANYLGKFTNAVDLTSSVLYENAGKIGLNTTTPLDFLHSQFTNPFGTQTGIAVQNLGSTANSYSGMLFYDQNGVLGQFQGFNNSTHEYRINNIASGGSINFMLGSASRFLVRTDGDIDLSGNIRKGGVLFAQTRGQFNVGLGLNAFAGASPGRNGVAIGHEALQLLDSSAEGNVAVGYRALAVNISGGFNTAIGEQTLESATGAHNLALGYLAGWNKVTGNRNIYVGYSVGFGAGNTESDTVRIGDSGFYSRFFAGGVRGVTTGQADAVAVVIDSNGQFGTVNSSRRYKEDIQDMGDASSGLMKLRPVTYRYTQAYADGHKPIDYGLIAEEVEQVYPDLVAHLKGGEVETVQYHKINVMLLNEVQKQHHELQTAHQQISDLITRLEALERVIASQKK